LDQSLVSSIELPAESWRKLTFTVGAIAVVEALVILVAALILVAKPFAHHLRAAAHTRAPLDLKGKTGPDTPAGAPTRTRAKTVVMVLNGNGRSGAAGLTADRLRRVGYAIGVVGNAARNDYPQSVIMYRRGFRPEAERLARDVHTRLVGPLDGLRTSQLGRAGLVYVVGER
jgi:hypothetical protein